MQNNKKCLKPVVVTENYNRLEGKVKLILQR